MAACASVLVLAGLVAVIAGAVGADRATALRLATDDTPAAAPGAPPAAAPPAEEPVPSEEAPSTEERPPGEEAPAGPPEAERVPDAVTATSLAVLPGWREVRSQDVVEVPRGRFEGATILRRGETVVLVGLADPARVPPRADPAVPAPERDRALDAEARRLADAYADQLAPGTATTDLTDNDRSVAGLPTRTSVRRVDGGALDGALARVSTIAAPGRTIAVLAVARPSPTIDADGDAADAVVSSLRLEPAGSRPRPGPAPAQPSAPSAP